MKQARTVGIKILTDSCFHKRCSGFCAASYIHVNQKEQTWITSASLLMPWNQTPYCRAVKVPGRREDRLNSGYSQATGQTCYSIFFFASICSVVGLMFCVCGGVLFVFVLF